MIRQFILLNSLGRELSSGCISTDTDGTTTIIIIIVIIVITMIVLCISMMIPRD